MRSNAAYVNVYGTPIELWVVSFKLVLVSRMVAIHGDFVLCPTFLFFSIFVSHLSESEEGSRDNLTGGLSGGQGAEGWPPVSKYLGVFRWRTVHDSLYL